MPQMIAVLKSNKITEILARNPRKKIVRDCERLVDVTGRPDLKVGDSWPFGPPPQPTPNHQE